MISAEHREEIEELLASVVVALDLVEEHLEAGFDVGVLRVGGGQPGSGQCGKNTRVVGLGDPSQEVERCLVLARVYPDLGQGIDRAGVPMVDVEHRQQRRFVTLLEELSDGRLGWAGQQAVDELSDRRFGWAPRK